MKIIGMVHLQVFTVLVFVTILGVRALTEENKIGYKPSQFGDDEGEIPEFFNRNTYYDSLANIPGLTRQLQIAEWEVGISIECATHHDFNNAFRSLVQKFVPCKGPRCFGMSWKGFEVEHIVGHASPEYEWVNNHPTRRDLDLGEANKDILGNVIMAWGPWNNNLQKKDRIGVEDRVLVYGPKINKMARQALTKCNNPFVNRDDIEPFHGEEIIGKPTTFSSAYALVLKSQSSEECKEKVARYLKLLNDEFPGSLRTMPPFLCDERGDDPTRDRTLSPASGLAATAAYDAEEGPSATGGGRQ